MFYGWLSIALLNVVYVTGFLFLSILLNVHETHYFLGFGSKSVSFQIRGVRFSIGCYIPIIGLAKIHVMVNGEKQRMKYPWEFYNQSLARRLGATLGGAFALLIMGVLIFIAHAYVEPRSIITKEEVNRHGIYPSNWAAELGFRRGDKVISVNGIDYDEYEDLLDPSIFELPESYYTVLRDGDTLQINVRKAPDDFQESKPLFLALHVPFEIAGVLPNSLAATAGILPGDRITRVNGHPIKFHDFVEECQKDEDGEIMLTIQRKGVDSLRTLKIPLSLSHPERFGAWPKELIHYTTEEKSLITAVGHGTYAAFEGPSIQVSAFVKLFVGRLSVKMSGPIGSFPTLQNSFLTSMGYYSMWYALCNLLPLPFSAFWEIVALAFEWVTKRKYTYGAFKWSTKAAWFILVAIVLSIMVMDVVIKFKTVRDGLGH